MVRKADRFTRRASDGGANWLDRTTGSGLSINAVTFLDSQNGWAAGQSTATLQPGTGGAGMLYHTTDGGDTWSRHEIGP